MKRKITFSALGTLLAVNLIVGTSSYLKGEQADVGDDPYESIALFTRTLQEVHDRYVDGGELTYSDLVNRALDGMLEGLDGHTEFMRPDRFEMLREDTEGEFGGIGVQVSNRGDSGFLSVVAPIDGTPGAKAGLRPGDQIIAIDGESTEDMSLRDAVDLLRGRPGAKVSLTIRSSERGDRDVEITRAVIKVATVKDINDKSEFPLIRGNIGYIRMSKFGEETFSDMRRAIGEMDEDAMRGLVLDLRDNPGGLLDEAVKVCEYFLPRGQLIVTTEGRDGQVQDTYRSATRAHLSEVPIVVMINEGSASASEIVAGCLQDVGRAIILGERSFGKGSVQSVIEMRNRAALRLTTAKYYTPSHKVIHGMGVTPDIHAPMSAMEMQYLSLKRTPGWLEELDDSTKEIAKSVEDRQLERALDVLTGLNTPAGKKMLEMAESVSESTETTVAN